MREYEGHLRHMVGTEDVLVTGQAIRYPLLLCAGDKLFGGVLSSCHDGISRDVADAAQGGCQAWTSRRRS